MNLQARMVATIFLGLILAEQHAFSNAYAYARDRLAQADTDTKSISPIDECNRLAASREDPERPSNIPGIFDDDVSRHRAIAACEVAVQLYPRHRRLHFQLGRALELSGQNEEGCNQYKIAADGRHALALFTLGLRTYEGRCASEKQIGTSKYAAFLLFEKAARSGLPMAMKKTGEMLLSGDGVAQDVIAAANWFEEAILNGDRSSHVLLSIIWSDDKLPGAPNWAKAADHFKLGPEWPDVVIRRIAAAAAARQPDALSAMADFYHEGIGVEKNEALANEFRQKADTAREPKTVSSPLSAAMSAGYECDQLASSPLDRTRLPEITGVEADKIDVASAVPACSAAIRAFPQSDRYPFQLGRALHHAGRTKEAVSQYEIAAAAGNPLAQNNLGAILLEGADGVPVDKSRAIALYRKAADQGFTISMRNLGASYRSGDGVAANAKLAYEWYRKAADAGDLEGMYFSAAMLANGEGIAQDLLAAVDRYRKAAELGHATSQYALGWMYDNGKGVARDNSAAANWYAKAAGQGFAEAQYALGRLYDSGHGLPADKRMAADLFRKAAEQGMAIAQFKLGSKYANGDGLPKNDKLAIVWYRKAAEQGLAEAQTNLGSMYVDGEGVKADVSEGLRWFRNAAARGEATAQFNLGVMYESGQGVPTDKRIAAEWYRQSAEQGNTKAQYALGLAYEHGEGVDQDKRAATEWYRKAADAGNDKAKSKLDELGIGIPASDPGVVDADVAVQTGIIFHEKHEYKNAMMWFRKGADNGNASAQLLIGAMYYAGDGRARDYSEAARWFLKAADRGNANAQHMLGIMYDSGEGVAPDKTIAAEWYRKAAEQGISEAQYNLALKFWRGEGLPKDQRVAVEWLRKAANQGSVKAQFNLGTLYDLGSGVDKNEHVAADWYRKAADKGDADAQYNLALKYEHGRGVQKDLLAAEKLLRAAVQADHRKAKIALARIEATNAAAKIIAKAGAGDAWAAFVLGRCYEDGYGVKADPSVALSWFRRAAEAGLAEAQRKLGDAFLHGKGIAKDGAMAVRWLETAASQGDASAAFELGNIFEESDVGMLGNFDDTNGVPHDSVKALKWYRVGAQGGDREASYRLGSIYRYGRFHGTIRDDRIALSWYQKAAKLGSLEAAYELGRIFEEGAGVPRNLSQALSWYKRSKGGYDYHTGRVAIPDAAVIRTEILLLAEKGDETAKQIKGHLVSVAGDPPGLRPDDNDRILDVIRKAADAGYAKAQLYMGLVNYMNPRGDKAKALTWLTKAASHGEPAAQFQIGLAHMHGVGVQEDRVAAMRWFSEAAKLDSTEALFYLGILHESENEFVDAAKYFRRAAERGYKAATFHLAMLYRNGRGVAVDAELAFKMLGQVADEIGSSALEQMAEMYEKGEGVPRNANVALQLARRAALLPLLVRLEAAAMVGGGDQLKTRSLQ